MPPGNNTTRRNVNKPISNEEINRYIFLRERSEELEPQFWGIYNNHYPNNKLIEKQYTRNLNKLRKGKYMHGLSGTSENLELYILNKYAPASSLFTKKNKRIANGKKAMFDNNYKKRVANWNAKWLPKFMPLKVELDQITKEIEEMEKTSPKFENAYKRYLGY